jgi:hypothetical protein
MPTLLERITALEDAAALSERRLDFHNERILDLEVHTGIFEDRDKAALEASYEGEAEPVATA